jgi:predicted nucleic acid-binding protein
MPLVVVDTSVSLPATLSPGGMMRRFWVVLALGALTYETEHGELELDELQRRAGQEGGAVRGLDRARARIEEAGDRRAALLELLPYGTPEDWVAIGSAPIFDEYERKLREIGHKLNPALREEDIPLLRRQLEAICPAATPQFRLDGVPALTEDPKDDPILHTALIGDADLLISDDKHLVPNRREHLWEHGEDTVLALTFNTLLTERLDAAILTEIDGSWLAVAYG